MGQTQSNFIPSGKHYKYSYCKQLDNLVYTFLPESINLSLNLNLNSNSKNDNYILNLIYVSIYYKIKNLGYNIKENKNYYISTYNIQLNTIIENVALKGIMSSSNEVLKDLSIVGKPYKVSLNNIKYLLSQGNILIAGIVLDERFGMEILQKVVHSLLTDIVLIVGYDTESIYILSNWKSEIIKIDIHFVDNILEIWNIEINSPEDYFLNKEIKI